MTPIVTRVARLLGGACVLAACVALPCRARAADASGTTETSSYAGATIACDASSLGVALLTPPLKSAIPSYFGAAGYLLCAPIVHGVHESPGRAFGSFGMRVGAPLAGALIGLLIWLSVDDCRGALCGLSAIPAIVIGAGVGALTAVVVDAAVLAKESRTQAPAAAAPPVTTQVFGVSF